MNFNHYIQFLQYLFYRNPQSYVIYMETLINLEHRNLGNISKLIRDYIRSKNYLVLPSEYVETNHNDVYDNANSSLSATVSVEH